MFHKEQISPCKDVEQLLSNNGLGDPEDPLELLVIEVRRQREVILLDGQLCMVVMEVQAAVFLL